MTKQRVCDPGQCEYQRYVDVINQLNIQIVAYECVMNMTLILFDKLPPHSDDTWFAMRDQLRRAIAAFEEEKERS